MSASREAPVIVEQIERQPSDVVQRLGALSVATIHESQERRGLLDPGIRPLVDGTRVAGVATTCVVHPGDNLMLLAALELCRPGDVLVIATAAPIVTGILGEIIASILVARGVAGVIVDNGVRDVTRLRELPLQIWARGISAMGTTKAGAGSVNVPVVCGGALVHPGDIIVADDDGVVVVAANDAAMIAERGEQRDENEAHYLDRIARGDVPGLPDELRTMLDRLGVRRVATTAELTGS